MHVFQVSGYTSSQPSTTASASLTTSTTGNFDFLSPLILAGRDSSTTRGVGWATNTNCKTLSRQVDNGVSCIILGNSPGNVSETDVARQEKMNSFGSVSLQTGIDGASDNFIVPLLQDQVFKITSDGTVISKNPSQPVSIYTNGVKDRNLPVLFRVINLDIGSTGVSMSIGTSANSSLSDNVANEQNLNVIPLNFPIMVTQQPLVPNVLCQS